MLQKVAAILGKVAADLCFRASKVRWLLHKKYFDFAASSAANLGFVYLVPLYTIVVLNTQRFGALMSESVSMIIFVTTSLPYRGVDSRYFPLLLYHWYVYFAFHKIEFSTFSIGFCVLVYTFSIDIMMHFCTFSIKLVVVFVKWANKNIEKV
jgi:hypothetical protein